MTAPLPYRAKQTVTALQWTGDYDNENAMDEFTGEVTTRPDGRRTVRTLFMPLNSDTARDVLPEAEILDLLQSAYTAVLYDDSEGTWIPVATGDWILKDTTGRLSTLRDEKFQETYEATAP